VIRRLAFDVAILGGGPCGLIAALAASKNGRVALVSDRLPELDGPVRIDSIPGRALALLTEFGVSPRSIGVDRLHEERADSWGSTTPRRNRGAPTAHIERPLLERALLDVVRSTGRISLVRARVTAKSCEDPGHAVWRAGSLIDATGRSSISAREKIRPGKLWASRFFWLERKQTHAAPEFRIAPLSSGYAYRLGSISKVGIGIVGRGRMLQRDLRHIERIMHEEGAGWLCQDLPPLDEMNGGASGVCSLQWSEQGKLAQAGDALLARDSLSSQGLAGSLSDALYAVAAVRSDGLESLAQRQRANLRTQLVFLKELLSRCRFRDQPVWRDYDAFIEVSLDAARAATGPALRDGALAASS
jgi:flavin-dependent dehydrogenase